jgi:hypothetical protein
VQTTSKIQGALASQASVGVAALISLPSSAVTAAVPTVETLVIALAPSVSVASDVTTETATAAANTSAPATSTKPKALPVAASKWQPSAQNQAGLLEVQLPKQVIGATSASVVVQLPSSVAADVAAGAAVKLNAMDNSAAPGWVQYSPQQGGLVVGNVPAGALPTQIRMLVGQQQLTIQLNAPGN